MKTTDFNCQRGVTFTYRFVDEEWRSIRRACLDGGRLSWSDAEQCLAFCRLHGADMIWMTEEASGEIDDAETRAVKKESIAAQVKPNALDDRPVAG